VSDSTPAETLQALRAKQVDRYARGDQPASDALVGSSPAMVRLRSQVAAAAASGATVLVVGSEPDQRFDVALAIHYQSPRAGARPLLRFDAAMALPDEFRQRLKTLLDEPTVVAASSAPATFMIESVESLPAEHQAQLLAAMSHPKWQVHLIATSGVVENVADHDGDNYASDALSDELLAAISTIEIDAPSLAERIEDVPQLAEWHLEELNRDAEREIDRFSADALDRLMLYDWPGGLPEFSGVVAAAHAQCQSLEIAPSDLPLVVHQAVAHLQEKPNKPQPIDLDQYLSDVESLLVTRALELARDNKAEAARLLGVSRPRLYRKLTAMGLVEPVRTKAKPSKPQPSKPKPTKSEPKSTSDSDIEFLPIDGEENT